MNQSLPNPIPRSVALLGYGGLLPVSYTHLDVYKRQDLVFLDPPYSGVHYSRFYHVLEGVARGEVGEVTGQGRYPEQSARPISDFSKLSTSRKAFNELLEILARKKANVIVTFPAGKASNGLSGDDVKALAADHFRLEEVKVSSRFSTLGGDSKHRAARQQADEMILTLSSGPKI